MAKYEDTRAGWEIFQESDYTLRLDEINSFLIRQRRSPVSDRTFRHYQKLVRYGFEHYLPINQLDVKTLHNPVWDAATRNRYTTLEANVPVRVRILGASDVLELDGHATRLSESIVIVHLVPSEATRQLPEQSIGLPAQLEFRGPREVVIATIDSISIRSRPRRISLRLGVLTPLPTPEVLGRERFAPAELLIRVSPRGQDVLLTQVVQQVYWFFQAIESASVISAELLVALDRTQRFAIGPTQIRRLRLESPLEVIVLGTLAGAVLLDRTLGKVLQWRKDFWEGSAAKETAKKLAWENERRRAVERIEIADAIEEAAAITAQQLGTEVPQGLPPFDQEKVAGIARRQLLPSVQEFVESADEVTIETKKQRRRS